MDRPCAPRNGVSSKRPWSEGLDGQGARHALPLAGKAQGIVPRGGTPESAPYRLALGEGFLTGARGMVVTLLGRKGDVEPNPRPAADAAFHG